MEALIRKENLMWQLAMVQGPNITFWAAEGTKRENKGEHAAAISFMLANGWEPMSGGDTNLVVVWFRKRIS